MNLTISINVVTYNSEKYISKCLNSIARVVQEIQHEIFVIDNNSVDRTKQLIKEFQNSITLIENGENFGFARAANMGLKRSSGEFILLLNPDVIIKSDSLQPMIDYMGNHQRVGICGCKLLNEDGSLQYSKGSFPTLFSTVYRMVLPRRMRKYHLSGYERVGECNWVTGAFMMIRHKMLEEIGFLDETFFLCYEDVDLCLRAKQKGYKTFYLPEVSAYHLNPYHLKSSSIISENIELEIRRSQLNFFEKHRNAYSYQTLKFFASLLRYVKKISNIFIFRT